MLSSANRELLLTMFYPRFEERTHEADGSLSGRVGTRGACEPPDPRAGPGRALRLEAAREVHAAGISGDAGGHDAGLDRNDGQCRRAGHRSQGPFRVPSAGTSYEPRAPESVRLRARERSCRPEGHERRASDDDVEAARGRPG